MYESGAGRASLGAPNDPKPLFPRAAAGDLRAAEMYESGAGRAPLGAPNDPKPLFPRADGKTGTKVIAVTGYTS